MTESLSDRIRLARRRKDWSQARLAQKLGVTASAVGHWERPGGGAPSYNRLAMLALVLEVRLEWLATGRGAMLMETATSVAEPLIASNSPEAQLVACMQQLSPRAKAALLEFLKFAVS